MVLFLNLKCKITVEETFSEKSLLIQTLLICKIWYGTPSQGLKGNFNYSVLSLAFSVAAETVMVVDVVRTITKSEIVLFLLLKFYSEYRVSLPSLPRRASLYTQSGLN